MIGVFPLDIYSMELAAYAKLAEEIRLDGREKVFPKQIVTLTTLIEKKNIF